MTEEPSSLPEEQDDHTSWVRTRMALDSELVEWIRHGFALIAVGFGSFAFLEGIAGVLGEGEGPSIDSPSRIFSLAATAIGVILIALALNHYRSMVEFVNADVYGAGPAPELPNEERTEYIAIGAIVIGVISFIALLFLR